MRPVALLVILCLLVGCAGSLTCPPDQFDPAGLNQPVPITVLAEAPLVIVAKVTEVRGIGPRRRAARLPSVLIDCTEITAEVENVLKGDLSAHTVTFYYYIFSEYNGRDLGALIYVPVLGERRMFFITRDAGALRSIGDVRDYTLGVASGYHDSSSLNSLPFGQKVATILLTPGQGYSDENFALQVVEGAYISDQFTSPEYTDRLLEALRDGKDRQVRFVANEELVGRALARRRVLSSPQPTRR